MSPAIKVENLSKQYRLGLTHSGSIRELVNRSFARLVWHRPAAVAPHADSSRVDDAGNFWALKDINFEINAGEVVGIIGRNGAGKSTLLKILSRITLPSAGRIEMRGRVASLLEVGTGFHPELTGRENVYMNGTILGMTKQEIDRQFDAIIDFAGVETFIDTPVKRYSSGMIVRLGFSVAAHLEPEILIVDEVLAVGDAQFQKRCLGKLDDVAKSGRTVLFVSHNLPAIRHLTSKCILIEAGHAVYHGDTTTALNRYLDTSEKSVANPSAIANVKRNSWAGDQTVRFVFAENMTPVIDSDENIRLCLAIRAVVVTDYCVGITLHGMDGEAIAAGFGPRISSQLETLQQKFTIEIRNPRLAPGKYWFTIGILHGKNQLLDAVQEVLHFEVTSDEIHREGLGEWNQSWGQIRLEMACDVSQNGSSESNQLAGELQAW